MLLLTYLAINLVFYCILPKAVSEKRNLLLLLLPQIAMAILSFFALKKLNGQSNNPIGWRLPGLRLFSLLALWSLVDIAFTVSFGMLFFQMTGTMGGTSIAAISMTAGPLTFLVLTIGGPVSEELFFRGWGLAWLRESASPGVAILLSAILFSMVHINPAQLPLTFIGGLFGAWLVVKTRSLVPYLICHALNNFYGFLMLYFHSKGAAPASSGLNSSLLHSVWPSLFCVLSGLLLWGVFKAIRKSLQNDRLVSSVISTH